MKKRRNPTPPPGSAWTRTTEWGVAVGLSILAIVFHIANLLRAGGLWRDEAAAFNLSASPSFGEIWSHLEHESFPLLLTLLLRAWTAIGLGGSDLGLRVFGLLVGMAVLAVLWWNAWTFSRSPPSFSLLLFALSPTLIRWGDSLRAYGLGVCFLLLALGLIWKLTRGSSTRVFLFSIGAAVLAVQSLYQSAFIVSAFCLAGAVVAARKRDFKRALVVSSIALAAAVSLLPYLGVVSRARQWNVLTETGFDLARIWLVFHRALSDAGPLMFWLWAALLTAALAAGCILLLWRNEGNATPDRDAASFLITVIVATTVAYYIFLWVLKFPTEVWYYLAWMGAVAVAVDALLSRISAPDWPRVVRLASIVVFAALMCGGAWQRVHVRMTNLDVAAKRLNQDAAEGDLILVHPWFCGPTIDRYYQGKAPWMTLPPLADTRLQRLDLFKEQMQLDAPVQPVLEKIEATLREGHVVWLVGYYPFSNPPRPAPSLPRPGEGPEGWNEAPYMTAYGTQVAYFLQAHALQTKAVRLELTQPVNPFENFPVMAVTGWRSSRF
jgi:hypothetical protein